MNTARTIRRTIYLLLFVLIFGGVLRKALPGGIGMIIFFAKDALCVLLLILVLRAKKSKEVLNFIKYWFVFCLIFTPVFFNTAAISPALAVFGAKQYLLFEVLVPAMMIAFPPDAVHKYRRLFYLLSLTAIPTALLAVIQLQLPFSHWLNQGVGGVDLSAFSAAGKPRVSATFIFVAQYTMYLNALYYMISTHMLSNRLANFRNLTKRPILIVIVASLIVGAFSTGSRSAVLGIGVSIIFTTIVVFLSNRSQSQIKLVGVFVIGTIALSVAQLVMPDAFLAYQARLQQRW